MNLLAGQEETDAAAVRLLEDTLGRLALQTPQKVSGRHLNLRGLVSALEDMSHRRHAHAIRARVASIVRQHGARWQLLPSAAKAEFEHEAENWRMRKESQVRATEHQLLAESHSAGGRRESADAMGADMPLLVSVCTLRPDDLARWAALVARLVNNSWMPKSNRAESGPTPRPR